MLVDQTYAEVPQHIQTFPQNKDEVAIRRINGVNLVQSEVNTDLTRFLKVCFTSFCFYKRPALVLVSL